MKKKISFVFILILFNIQLNAQDGPNENFKLINNEKFFWSRIYETNKSTEELLEYFVTYKNMEVLIKNEKRIEIKYKGQIDKKKFRNSLDNNMQPSSSIYNHPIVFNATIEMKDGKYRVIASDFSFHKKHSTSIHIGFGITTNRDNKIETLEKIYINKNKGTIRPNFLTSGAHMFNDYLIYLFGVQDQMSIENDW